MSPELLRTFFRSGMFIVLVALVLIFAVPRESAEFVISVCSLMIGLSLLGLIALASRFL
ncbi:MAG: hypothetical protein RLP44_18965 [Aggregatilineales bacterium]